MKEVPCSHTWKTHEKVAAKCSKCGSILFPVLEILPGHSRFEREMKRRSDGKTQNCERI